MFFKNQRIGKYEILDTIGTGGFGSVYLAQDIWIDKKVAIKVPHRQGENVEKLLQEPRLLAQLNHPNIVGVITAEMTNDVFFIVMEYVEGSSLEQYLRKHRRLEIPQALEWFLQLGDAISYAHDKNILHRDIRPANVLISKEQVVKLADLGTSRLLIESRFASTRIGSPPYMAPEHFQGKTTLQSDIYSFGVLMYECLTGRLPYFDRDPLKLARLAREAQIIPPHQIYDDVPLELSQIVLKAMHRLLGSRYQSAQTLTADLKRINPNARSEAVKQLTQKLPEPARSDATPKRMPRVRDIPTKEFSDLFCWNCSRPIQRRTQHCPHCNVALR